MVNLCASDPIRAVPCLVSTIGKHYIVDIYIYIYIYGYSDSWSTRQYIHNHTRNNRLFASIQVRSWYYHALYKHSHENLLEKLIVSVLSSFWCLLQVNTSLAIQTVDLRGSTHNHTHVARVQSIHVSGCAQLVVANYHESHIVETRNAINCSTCRETCFVLMYSWSWSQAPKQSSWSGDLRTRRGRLLSMADKIPTLDPAAHQPLALVAGHMWYSYYLWHEFGWS